MGSVGSFARIQEFLDKGIRVDARRKPLDFLEELSSISQGSTTQSVAEKGSVQTESPTQLALSFKDAFQSFSTRDAIAIHDGCFGWDSEKPLLKDITMNVPRGKLTMLIGPVGCGKSTLLKAILGEVPTMGGTVQMSSVSVAYCDQTPWHMNGSIQKSIVCFSEFEKRWYDTVVQACGLVEDFKQLPHGDQYVIGSRGIALSGGQSQRIVGRNYLC